jgi:hypothetical protein
LIDQTNLNSPVDIPIIAANAKYSRLADAVYADTASAPLGWCVTRDTGNTRFGMRAKIFVDVTNETVVAFRGTANWPDWITDIGAGLGGLWPEMGDALTAAQESGVLTFVGHSLGGAMAQLAAASLGGRAITFDPAPLTALLLREAINSILAKLTATAKWNITNFRGVNDPVTTAFGALDLGKAITVKNTISVPSWAYLYLPNIPYNHDIRNLVLAMTVVELVFNSGVSTRRLK